MVVVRNGVATALALVCLAGCARDETATETKVELPWSPLMALSELRERHLSDWPERCQPAATELAARLDRLSARVASMRQTQSDSVLVEEALTALAELLKPPGAPSLKDVASEVVSELDASLTDLHHALTALAKDARKGIASTGHRERLSNAVDNLAASLKKLEAHCRQ